MGITFSKYIVNVINIDKVNIYNEKYKIMCVE